MKLFAHHPGATMSMIADDRLRGLLHNVIREESIRCALETGTYLGTGSSVMIADALMHRPRPRFLTIEADRRFWLHAKVNLSSYGFVECLWGRTVRIEEALAFMQQDEALRHHERHPEIFIDDIEDPAAFYTRECRGEFTQPASNDEPDPAASLNEYASEDLLRTCLRTLRDKKPPILLDSAGGIGLLEFRITMDTMRGRPFLLLLDDVHHLKHFRSLALVRGDPHFDLLGVDEQAGWALALHRPS